MRNNYESNNAKEANSELRSLIKKLRDKEYKIGEQYEDVKIDTLLQVIVGSVTEEGRIENVGNLTEALHNICVSITEPDKSNLEKYHKIQDRPTSDQILETFYKIADTGVDIPDKLQNDYLKVFRIKHEPEFMECANDYDCVAEKTEALKLQLAKVVNDNEKIDSLLNEISLAAYS